MTESAGHLHAAVAGFARAAEDYERSRPGYPDAAVDHVAAALRLGPASVVADVAAGTGKLSRALVGRAGFVVAVEPVAGMRQVLRAAAPAVAVVAATAEALPLADASVDAVTVAQAFHWFDGAAALAAFRRVLRPDGALAIAWNERDLATPLQHALQAVLEPHRGTAPSYHSGAWRRALDRGEGFGPLSSASFAWSSPASAEALVNRVLSTSFIAALPVQTRRDVAAQVRSVFDRYAGESEVVQLAYTTWVHVTRRRD